MSLDEALLDAFKRVFKDEDPTSWLLAAADKKGKLQLRAAGVGALAEASAGFLDDAVMYAWVRLNRTDGGGDSKRVKFVLLTWIGESAGAMSKMRVTEHKAVLAAVKSTHVTFAITEREGLKTLEADLDAALRKAGGADYDAGNAAAGVTAGATSAIKSHSKSFFEQKDKETEIGKIQFEKFTRTGKEVSACDLGNRAMTASASEMKHNVVGYKM